MARSICALFLSLLLSLSLVACGAPAIVDASQRIADARGCQAAEVSVAGEGGRYAAEGCGEPGMYQCAEGACAPTEGSAAESSARVAAAHAALAPLDADLLRCVDGRSPLTVQVRFDASGRPQGLVVHPAVSGDERVCLGRLVLGVEAPASATEMLVAHVVGAEPPPAEPEPEPGLEPTPTEPTDPAGEATSDAEPWPNCTGEVTPADALAMVRAATPAMQACYETAMAEDPTLAERDVLQVQLRALVSADGVDRIRLTPAEPAGFIACLRGVIEAQTAPTVEGDCAIVSAPLRFTPAVSEAE